MKLDDLLKFNPITIQCHDNPDPDALASAFGLYLYFKEHDKDVSIIYGGRNPITKSNLRLLIDEFSIPVEYRTDKETPIEGLLLTADCQYGEGNVTPFKADNIAIIDHHQSSGPVQSEMDYTEIHSYLGSCSTLVWMMLREAGYDVDNNEALSTALYYGLMTDTGNFVEVHHPLDRDMMDELKTNRTQIYHFCNSNISLQELGIAGDALIRNDYDEKHRFNLIMAEPCDPNILGLISDLALQVDVVDTVVVFNETPDGYKFSVRSCVKEVHSDDMAAFISEGIGSGGGHIDKAGGFISKSKFERNYPGKSINDYLSSRVSEYFDDTEIIVTKDYTVDTSTFKKYVKKRLILGFADPEDFLRRGTEITVRTLEGDIEMEVDGTFYVMIGIFGEVYPMKKERFEKSYEVVTEPYQCETDYLPTVRRKGDGQMFNLTENAHSCRAKSTSYILAGELDHRVKIFTLFDENNYYLGKEGDFLACREDDTKDVYIIAQNVFAKTYDLV